MTNKLKQLQENRGAKIKEIRALLDKAAADKRALTADESTKITGIESEVDGLNGTIDAEVRQLAREGSKQNAYDNASEGEQRDVQKFNFGKFIRHLKAVKDGDVTPLDGVEGEMIVEGRKEAREAGVQVAGISLPSLVLRRRREVRDVTATGTTSTSLDQGGQTIATEKKGIIDGLYENQFVAKLGGQVLTGLRGNLDLPRYVADADPAHKGENIIAAEVAPTFATLSLTPKRLPSFVDCSDQLFMQSSDVIENVLRRNLDVQTRVQIEKMVLHGSGGSGEPTGIFATTGIGVIYAGGASSNGTNTAGAAPVWADMINFETTLAASNADVGSVALLVNAKLRGKLKSTARLASTDSFFIWDDRAQGLINGYRPYTSNCVSSALSKGASSGILSGGVFANWADLVLAFWSGISFELIRDSANAKLGMHTLVMNTYYDTGAQRPASFVVCKDFLTS